MIQKKIPFSVKTDIRRSQGAVGQRLVNMYAEPNGQEAKADFTLYGTPGLPIWTTMEGGVINGTHIMNETMYVVSGSNLYRVDTNKTKTLIGSIGSQTSRVFMSDNGTQLAILKSDGTLWVSDGVTVSEISIDTTDFEPSSSMTYSDGFGIFAKADSQQFFISGLFDFTTYDALDFSTASEASDNIVRIFAFRGSVWVFGSRSIQLYSNTGDTDFPFQLIQGASDSTIGCGAKYSVAQIASSLFWLGSDRRVYTATGYTPNRISDYGIEKTMQDMTTVSDAFGATYTYDGHSFYVLTFPTENKTFVLNLNTMLWHDAESYGLGKWRVNNIISYAEQVLCGDYNNGNIYYLDVNTYTDNADIIQRWIYTQNLYAEGNRFVIDRLELGIDGGTGLITGQGSDPQIMMQYSDDGQKTWSPEQWTTLGKVGTYYTRAVWRRQGITRQRSYRFLISDPVAVKMNGLYASIRLYGA